MPEVFTVWRTSTASNQPQRRGAARHRAEFAAAFADGAAGLVVQFGRERAFADAGRIGLGDAQHIADRLGPEAGARWRRWTATVFDEVTKG